MTANQREQEAKIIRGRNKTRKIAGLESIPEIRKASGRMFEWNASGRRLLLYLS